MEESYTLTNKINANDINKVNQTFYDDKNSQFDPKHHIDFITQYIFLNDDKVIDVSIEFYNGHAGMLTSYPIELSSDKHIWADDKKFEEALLDRIDSLTETSPERLLLEQMINELHAYNDDGSLFYSEIFSFFRENILSQASLWFVNKDNEIKPSIPLSKDELSLLKFIDEETDNTLTGDSFIEEVLPQLWLKLNKDYNRWLHYKINDDDPMKLHREIVFDSLINKLTELAKMAEELKGTKLVIKRFDSND